MHNINSGKQARAKPGQAQTVLILFFSWLIFCDLAKDYQYVTLSVDRWKFMKMFENFKKGLVENESILSIIVSFLSKSLDRLTNQPTDRPRCRWSIFGSQKQIYLL